MMRALDRKLFRDLLTMKGQIAAIALVIGCGVAMFIMALSTLASLQRSQQQYYEDYRFAHVFARLKRAPQFMAAELMDIPGVARLQTRVVVEVTLDVPGLAEPAVGRINSMRPGEQPTLNQLHLRRGRWLEPGRRHEVLVGEQFAEAHGFHPGDSVTAIINGRMQRLTMVGVVLSPEYIYQIRSGDFVPDDLRFGVFWMDEEELEAAYDMEGAFNDVSIALSPGANEREVIRRVDQLTERYGGLGAHGRDEHVSHRFVSDEIQQLRAISIIPPTIFLSVAAFLLNIVISRLIATQREQIATLKAFGYTKLETAVHYFKFVLVIVLVGMALGAVGGYWLGRGMTALYAQFFRFPAFDYGLGPGSLLAGLGVALVAAAAALSAVRRAAILPPAEAMRPEAPPTFRPTILERMGLQQLVSPAMRMVLRQLERRPLRAGLSIFGVALAVAVVVLGQFSGDAIYYLIDHQFYRAQRYDVSVSFVEPRNMRALRELESLPGVLRAEPYRAVAVRLRSDHHQERVAVMGLPIDAGLQQVIDSERGPMQLPSHGLVLSQTLAELLHVGRGASLTVEVLQEHRPVVPLHVSGIVHEYIGLSAYMDREAVNRLMQEGDVITGALLAVDERYMQELFATLKRTPMVRGVVIKDAAIVSFENTIAENLLWQRSINMIFASIIAFGVVYNSARISLSERSRELASLRVLGFTRGEISMILLGELAVIVLLAVPLGLVMGHYFAWGATTALHTETARIPFVISHAVYGRAMGVIMIAALVSGLVVRRRLDHLDLVSVLKVKE